MSFALPDSYRAYCTDAAVRTAVDHLLSSADKKTGLSLPADIDWSDLPAFHRAVLSAHQVRCERAVFLFDLWDAVWEPALAESGLRSDLDPWTVADTEEWQGRSSIRRPSGTIAGSVAISTSAAVMSSHRVSPTTLCKQSCHFSFGVRTTRIIRPDTASAATGRNRISRTVALGRPKASHRFGRTVPLPWSPFARRLAMLWPRSNPFCWSNRPGCQPWSTIPRRHFAACGFVLAALVNAGHAWRCPSKQEAAGGIA